MKLNTLIKGHIPAPQLLISIRSKHWFKVPASWAKRLTHMHFLSEWSSDARTCLFMQHRYTWRLKTSASCLKKRDSTMIQWKPQNLSSNSMAEFKLADTTVSRSDALEHRKVHWPKIWWHSPFSNWAFLIIILAYISYCACHNIRNTKTLPRNSFNSRGIRAKVTDNKGSFTFCGFSSCNALQILPSLTNSHF